MKTLFRIISLFALLACFAACSSDEETKVPVLEVNYANVEGTWKLTEWNGQPVSNATYCYITFVRKEKTFKIYQKMDSMYARLITGSFVITEDAYLGYIISGTYDYGMGDWNKSYIVTDLLQSGSMIWTDKNDLADVSKYERCDKVPADILQEVEAQ